MENMDKGITVPKWVPKSAKNNPNAAKFINPSLGFRCKKVSWPSVVRDPD